MFRLDINALHRAGALLEGAVTEFRGIGGCRPSTRPGQKDVLVAGLGALVWRGEKIEFEWQPIIARNPPPSWGARSYRSRPKFVCPAGCGCCSYHLYLVAEDRFACRKCAGVEYPSRANRDPDAALRRRLDRARARLARLPVPRAPRSKWLRDRLAMRLRLAEMAAVSAFEDFLNREERRARVGPEPGKEPQAPQMAQ